MAVTSAGYGGKPPALFVTPAALARSGEDPRREAVPAAAMREVNVVMAWRRSGVEEEEEGGVA